MTNDEPGMKRGNGGWRRSLLFCLVPCASCLALLAGCSKKGQEQGATSRPSTLRERQDKALKDPFGYSPDVDRTDISGGGLTGFDRDGFGKDMKNVLDP
jgi:hypothetical protein